MNFELVMLRRVARNLALVCGVLTVTAFALWPDRPRVTLGVIGGGLLAGLSFWGLSAMVLGLVGGAETGENGRISRSLVLVKFFTRHAILALVAYLLMVRWHLDPVAMLAGVTSIVVALALEAARPR